MRHCGLKTTFFSGAWILALACILAFPVSGTAADKDTIKIGITQIVTHPALDANRQGFIDQLEKEGFVEGKNVKYDFRNPEGDMSLAASIAQKFVSEKVDLILAIATPTAQACVNAVQDTDIPVVFGAVTDPVAAGLVDGWDHPGGNVTGISDWADVGTQIELILDIVPEVKKLGVIYNSGETNSKVQVDELNKVAPDLGIEKVLEANAATTANVMAAAQSLMGRVDAVWVPTDNTVVSAFEAVVKVCEDNQVPVFAADTATVERGAIGTPGIDYYVLGLENGKIGARILKGTAPADIAVQKVPMTNLHLNPAAAKRLGVSIPQAVMDRATKIIEE